MNKVIAMIPARLGSKRVKNKNLKEINGKPLISYIVETAVKSNVFDEIYINSESEIFKDIADKYGIKFYKRPEELSTDSATNDQFALDFIENNPCDTLVQLLSTDYKFAVSFSILVIVLLYRPSGIFKGKVL